MKDATLSRILAFFTAIFVVIVAVAVFAVRYINQAGASRDWVNHTYATISAFENTLAALRAGDAAMRTFALSGSPQDLADSRTAFAEMDENLQIAKALTRDTPDVQKALLAIETLAGQRADLAASVWQARRENQTARLQQILADDAGSGVIADLRRRFERLRDDQFSLLRERERTAYRQAQTTRWIVGTGVAFNLLLFAAVAWLIRDDLNARRRATAALEEANAQLEEKVRARTAELTEVNRRLTAENFERKWTSQSQEHQLRYNQAIVNAVSDLVFVLTKTLAITRINPAVRSATGREETGLLGRPLGDVVGLPGASGQPLAAFTQALGDGRDLRNVSILLAGRAARLDLFPLRDRDKVVGGIAIARLESAPPPTP